MGCQSTAGSGTIAQRATIIVTARRARAGLVPRVMISLAPALVVGALGALALLWWVTRTAPGRGEAEASGQTTPAISSAV